MDTFEEDSNKVMRILKSGIKEKLLLLMLLVISAVPLRQFYLDPNRLVRNLQRLAGPEAIDCGVSHSISTENNEDYIDGRNVQECAVAAFKAKKPFLMRNEEKIEPGTEFEALLISGIARTPDGRVFYSQWDSSFRNWWEFPSYKQAECPEPTVENGYLECAACKADARQNTASCPFYPGY